MLTNLYTSILENNNKRIAVKIKEYSNYFIYFNNELVAKELLFNHNYKKSSFIRNICTKKPAFIFDFNFYLNSGLNLNNFSSIYNKYNIPTIIVYRDIDIENTEYFNYFKYINSIFVKLYNITSTDDINTIDSIKNTHLNRFEYFGLSITDLNIVNDDTFTNSFINKLKLTSNSNNNNDIIFIYFDLSNFDNIVENNSNTELNFYKFLDKLYYETNSYIIIRKIDTINLQHQQINKNRTYIINDVLYNFTYETSPQQTELEYNMQQSVIQYIKLKISKEIPLYAGVGLNIQPNSNTTYYYNYILDTIFQYIENYNYPLSYNTVKQPNVDNYTIKYNQNREIYADGNNINAGRVNNIRVNNQQTSGTLWTSDKILEYIDEKIRNLKPPDLDTIKLNTNNRMYVDEEKINAGFVKGYRVDLSSNNALWNGIKIIEEIIKIANQTLLEEVNKIDGITIIFDMESGRLRVKDNYIDLKSVNGVSVDFSYVNINTLTISNDYTPLSNKLITSNVIDFYVFKEIHKNVAYENSKYLSPTARYFVYNTLSQHTNPQINDIVYENLTNKLYKYIRKNKWIEINWVKYIKSTDDYKTGFLVIDENNNLYVNKNKIDENSNELIKIYPLVGSNNFFIINTTYLYYLLPGKSIYYNIQFNTNTNIPVVVNPEDSIISINKSIFPSDLPKRFCPWAPALENKQYILFQSSEDNCSDCCYYWHIVAKPEYSKPYSYIEMQNSYNKIYRIYFEIKTPKVFRLNIEFNYYQIYKNTKYDNIITNYIQLHKYTDIVLFNNNSIYCNYYYNTNHREAGIIYGHPLEYNPIIPNEYYEYIEYFSSIFNQRLVEFAYGISNFNSYNITSLKFINNSLFRLFAYHNKYNPKSINENYYNLYFNQTQLINIRRIKWNIYPI